MRVSRRDAIAGAILGAGGLLRRADAEVTPEIVQFSPEIEPLVRLVEDTPRERCAEVLVDNLRRGVSYREWMSALFLAGIRNVNPRPPGFALHCVFVIHSAHTMALEAPADLRLLPLFYAFDNFKAAQVRDASQKTGDYRMQVVRGALPASSDLQSAMEAWDIERAERAVTAMVRERGGAETINLLWQYGARDYRNIGHKAIYVANAHRTLQTIGWQHSEPVLRSLVLALLDFRKDQSMNGYALEDQCFNGNVKRLRETVSRLNAGWMSASPDAGATTAILDTMRQATPDEACADIASRLVKGTASAASVWDAIHLASAELRMRARGGAAFAGVHAVTSANALHHAWASAPDLRTRYLMLLQAAGWMTQFRTWGESREELRKFTISSMKPAEQRASFEKALQETLASIPSDTDKAASEILQFANNLNAERAYRAAAIRLTLSRADEVHYMKYLAALIEDIPLMSAEFQPHMLASTAYYMRGPADPEPDWMKRAKEALRTLPA